MASYSYSSTHTGLQIDDGATQALIVGYGACSTAAATTAKVVTITPTNSSFTLTTGARITVKFSYAVPASATLNVNSTGAKSIRHQSAAISANIIKAGEVVEFVYDGSYWVLIGTTIGYVDSRITTALNTAV